jgi:hypothetical protein
MSVAQKPTDTDSVASNGNPENLVVGVSGSGDAKPGMTLGDPGIATSADGGGAYGTHAAYLNMLGASLTTVKQADSDSGNVRLQPLAGHRPAGHNRFCAE